MAGRIFYGEVTPVGREVEFRTLVSGLDKAAEGGARLMLVRGPAGSGKTALLNALERYARRVGVMTMRGSCSPAGARLPWRAAESLFGGALFHLEGSTVPLSHRLFRRVSEATMSGPVAVMFDDAQWCDEESLTWLDFLMNRGHHLPLFVLLAQHRSGLSNGRRAVPGVAARGHRIVDLWPLSEEDAGRMARRYWDAVPKEPFVRVCSSACRGNPALLARLFKRLSKEGVPPDARGEFRAAEFGAELYVGHLLATLDRQPEYVRGVVEAFAVLGNPDAELVGMLSGVSEPLVAAAVDILRDERIIDVGLAELNEDHVRAAVLSGRPAATLDRRRSWPPGCSTTEAGRPRRSVRNWRCCPGFPKPGCGMCSGRGHAVPS